ncbi:MAG: 2-phosphosulfolactate phosphatase [Bacteroidales bacterium]|nr:2-phosphosulfolactate phosphatase [Bacteroidales bacterium]
MTKNIDIVAAPALYPYHRKGGTIVLIDVLRFTSTLTTALANGALWAEAYPDTETVFKLKKEGYIIAGEKNGLFIQGFDYNNSPVSMTRENIEGQKLAFVTTNGTYMRSLIEEYDAVYAGCFLNGKAMINRLIEEEHDVQLVCSGRQRKIALEDLMFAGMVAEKLLESGKFSYTNDIIPIAIATYQSGKKDIKSFIQNNLPDIQAMLAKFKHYSKDFEFCFNYDMFDVVPEEITPLKFVVKRR